MRIGIDVRLQNESGVGRYIRNLTQELKKIDKDNEYTFINPPVRWHSVKEQLIMPFTLYGKRLDLVHFPYFNVPLFYFGKFIVTIHDLTISYFETGRASTLNPLLYKIKRLGYKLVLWNAIHRAQRIIVPTNAVKKEILQKYKVSPVKIAVIYEGVEIKSKIQSTKSKKLTSIKPKQYFLYVGNAYPHKNLNALISVVAQLQNIRLVLVGKEDYFYKLLKKKVKKMKLDKKVVFTGFVSDTELAWLYQNAIALIQPSLMEGFGLPALEAMQAGCLVLCSNIPALQEVCRDAAVYFNPNSIEDIVDSMQETVKNPRKYQEKIKLGKKRAGEFSWKKTAVETLNIYNEVFRMP